MSLFIIDVCFSCNTEDILCYAVSQWRLPVSDVGDKNKQTGEEKKDLRKNKMLAQRSRTKIPDTFVTPYLQAKSISYGTKLMCLIR